MPYLEDECVADTNDESVTDLEEFLSVAGGGRAIIMRRERVVRRVDGARSAAQYVAPRVGSAAREQRHG